MKFVKNILSYSITVQQSLTLQQILLKLDVLCTGPRYALTNKTNLIKKGD
jgi:hypothetical protein